MSIGIAILIFWVSLVVLAAACCLKGKWVLGVLTRAIWPAPLALVAAIRNARPDSWWARNRYDAQKLAVVAARSNLRGRRRKFLEALVALALLIAYGAFLWETDL
jgi:hypothetical protein